MLTSSSHRGKEQTVRCYQCDKLVAYLFSDARCKDCTRMTPEEVRGETTTRKDVQD